jgi:hypothetical protein
MIRNLPARAVPLPAGPLGRLLSGLESSTAALSRLLLQAFAEFATREDALKVRDHE